MNKNVKKTIKEAFKHTKYTVRFGNDWINISTPKGINCEFYSAGETVDGMYVVATYTIKNKETEIDLYIPDEVDEFVSVCDEILKEYK